MEYLIGRIGDRAVWMRKLSSPIHPIIKELIEEKAKHSRKYKIVANGGRGIK